ncbi:hypothetical protein [Brenneria tiliae]|uniref:Uncharacterized protein n=1 Tax=Brenneria tiliae TaxID=2914984 RepID=A0ABT0MSN8_9GAMM|nr:hypothetical protein [Brenneria tiliae]MCL2892869.1 hypothetical protein [Brenneria tiliae]MCL2898001.1 hypothetical protein [Brenneria tiliae]MCL2902082.1 hypothetical protein [Brenneria tiliae]
MPIIETIESQDLNNAITRILQRISCEPAQRMVLYKMLSLCETARSAVEIEQALLSYPEMKVVLQPPSVLLAWLAQAGGVEQLAGEDSAPRWRTTPAGRHVVRREHPTARLTRLLAQEPVYRPLYLQVLQACVVPKTKSGIDAMLRDNPLFEHPKVYASYFIEALEQAGGLEWNDGWQTTRSGIKVIDENNYPD